jgi:uncharacterized repeat protein (TIGR01451 family)
VKTRKWLVSLLVAAAFVSLSAGVASASGGTGGGGTTTSGADLQVAGSASTGSPNAGAAFSYTFQLKNSGPDAANSVVFTDPLPIGTVPNYATAGGSTLPCAAFGDNAGGTYFRCNVGTIPKGGQVTVVVNVNAPSTASTFSNTGTATSSTADPQTANNSVTVTVQVKASTGGVCKGGVCDTTTTTAAPCALLGSVSAPVGYYSVWAAIWNTMTVTSCSTTSEIINIEVTETNVATGLVDYDVVVPTTLTASQNLSMVLDNDFAPFNTTYTVTITVRDASANVLATAAVNATTPPPQ